jgi:hypothetical protein
MEYLIPLVIVLLLVAGFVTFLVMNATRRGQSASRREEPQSAPPGIGQDSTPFGDTSEHAGEQTESGRTVGRQDADEAGGTGGPVHSGYEGTSAAGRDSGGDSAHVRRSGEGEGTERLEFPDVEPPEADRAPTDVARAGDDESAGERRGERPGAQAAASDDDGPAEQERGGAEQQPDRPASERLADRGF